MAKLAHQSVPTPILGIEAANKDYVDKAVAAGSSLSLFSWNHTDTTQFSLVDPLAAGWSVSFVAATFTSAEHIRIRAPNAWTGDTGPAYLMVTADLASADYEIIAEHNFIDPGTVTHHTAGPVCRYVDANNNVSMRWRQGNSGDGSSSKMTIVSTVGGVDTTLATADELLTIADASTIVRMHSSLRRNMAGAGWGRISVMAQVSGAVEPALLTDQTVGFGIFSIHKTGAGSLEQFRLYDFVVKGRLGG